MKTFLQIIGLIIGISAALYFGIMLATMSIDADERNECRKWQEQAAQYSGFYIVQWQKDQCDAHSIIINAPVK